jgi:hypothetical protein
MECEAGWPINRQFGTGHAPRYNWEMEPATIIALLSVVISVLSLAVAGTTLWFNLLNRGKLAMTPPTVVFFGYDPVPKITPKVFLRTLLYSTAAHGQIVEGMYTRLRRNGNEQLFSF